MNQSSIGSIVEGVGKIAEDLSPSDEENLKLQIQEKSYDRETRNQQFELNKAEAGHKSIFIAGWRPFIGWIGGLALAYQFLLHPVLTWVFVLLQAKGIIPCHLVEPANINNVIQSCSIVPPPVFEAGPLFAIVTGMLGIGGMRSYDKLKKTDTKSISGK